MTLNTLVRPGGQYLENAKEIDADGLPAVAFPARPWGASNVFAPRNVRHVSGIGQCVWCWHADDRRPTSQRGLRDSWRDLPVGGAGMVDTGRVFSSWTGATVERTQSGQELRQPGRSGSGSFVYKDPGARGTRRLAAVNQVKHTGRVRDAMAQTSSRAFRDALSHTGRSAGSRRSMIAEVGGI